VRSATQTDQYASLEYLLANTDLYIELDPADKLNADIAVARDSTAIVHVGTTEDGVYYKWKRTDEEEDRGTEEECFGKANETFVTRKYYQKNF